MEAGAASAGVEGCIVCARPVSGKVELVRVALAMNLHHRLIKQSIKQLNKQQKDRARGHYDVFVVVHARRRATTNDIDVHCTRTSSQVCKELSLSVGLGSINACVCAIFFNDDKDMGTHITLKSTGRSCPWVQFPSR